jgi:hypothetical protein
VVHHARRPGLHGALDSLRGELAGAVEVIGARLLADREVMPQALKLNPAFFKTVYSDLLNMKKTRTGAAGAGRDRRVPGAAGANAVPAGARLLREAAEARSCSEIEAWFKRHFDVAGVTTACEYLADQGLIGKVSTPVHLTKKSNVILEELAFVHLGEPPG